MLRTACLIVGFLCLAAPALPRAPADPAPGEPPCAMTGSAHAWLQEILDGWMRTAAELESVDAWPLPRTVLFDARCAWHLGGHLGAGSEGWSDGTPIELPLRLDGKPVGAVAVPHEGEVRLPNGAEIPADIIAVAMPGPGEGEAFFVLALPEIWRRNPESSDDPHIDLRLQGVALHEMLHTQQLPELRRRIRALAERYELPPKLDDDVIETRFGDDREYRRLFERELDLLFRAVAAPDAREREELTGRALAVARERRERFFAGADAPYAELEALFLNLEGAAEWVRYRYHRTRPEWPNERSEILTFLRGDDNDWVQDEGLALTLLLDRVSPGWQDRLVGAEMASPFDLLEAALAPPVEPE